MIRAWLALLLVGCAATSTPAPAIPAAAPAPAVRATASGPGRVVTERLSSKVLGVDKDVVVYLPGGYEQGEQRYPVVYLLHGLGGNETDWVRLGGLVEAADAMHLAAIVVMPDGDGSFYVDGASPADHDACLRGEGVFNRQEPASYCVRSNRYEAFMSGELIAWVDAKFRTVARREGRALSGLSMGGFGALMLSMRHPDLYASAASHAGVAALLYAGPWPYEAARATLTDDVAHWGADFGATGAHIRGVFGPDVANWRAHDPALLIGDLPAGELALQLDCGDADEFGLQAGAQFFAERARRSGHTVELTIVPGGKHDWEYWKSRVDDGLAFHVKQFVKAGLN